MGNTTIPAELVAINAIQGTLIADNAITAVHIGQNQVHSVQLAINSVTATQIADGTITSAKIQDGAIATADIADVQITTAKLADNSVTSAKIVNASIVSADIANNAILTQHIDDNQITADQIADNAVGLGQLASLSRGSLIYGNSAGNPAYLAAGTNGHVLTSDGTDISWTADTDLFLATTGGTITGDLTISEATPTLKFTDTDNNYDATISGLSGSLVLIADSGAEFGTETIQFHTGGAEQMRITSTGDVKVGALAVSSATTAPLMVAKASTDVQAIFGDNNSSIDDPSIRIIGRNTANNAIRYTFLGLDADENHGYLGYNAGAGGFVNALNFDTSGKVGIGTSSPDSALTVNTSTTGDGIELQSSEVSIAKLTRHVVDSTVVASLDGVSGRPIHIGGVVNEKVILANAGGNVGIGTSPSYKLDISGTGDIVQYIANANPSGSQGRTLLLRDNYASSSQDSKISFAATSSPGHDVYLGKRTTSNAGYFHLTNSSGTEHLTVNMASGNVGIGENTPLGKLHIKENDSGQSSVNSNFDQLVLEDDSHSGMTILSGTSSDGAIYFGDSGGNNRGQFKYRHGSDSFGFITADGSGYALILESDDTAIFGGDVGIGTTPTAGKLDILGGSNGVSVRVRGDVGGGAYYYGYMFDGTNLRGTTQTNIFYSGSAIAANTTVTDYAGIRIDQPSTAASGAVVTNNYAIYSSGSAQKSYFAGKVGIGTTTPENNHAKANNLVVGGGGAGGMAVYNGTAEGWYAFSRSNANNTDAFDGGMSYTDRVLRLHTNAGGTRLKIDGSGDTEIYGHLSFEDNKLLMFGGGQDARLYFDATTNALMITASNGTANTVNITTNNFQIGGATPLISGTANDSVVINQDGASNVDFRVETDNEQYALFVDASSEIIHVGEGTNSDMQQVIPAKTLHYRRHGYHGGNRTHGGRTFKYAEGNSWTDAVKIEWNNDSWGAVNMRIKGQGYYNTTDGFDVVISFQGHAAHVGGNFGATSVAGTYTHFINIVRDTTGETTIQQRNSNNTSNVEDIVFMYEWVTNNRSDQTILVTDL